MSKTPMELALEFISSPDERAQVKVRLCANGWPQLADMIDEAVCVSRELLRLEAELTAAKEKIAELERNSFLTRAFDCQQLEAQIKALREESERLDWFIDNCDDPPWEAFWYAGNDDYRTKSRAHIDAARKK